MPGLIGPIGIAEASAMTRDIDEGGQEALGAVFQAYEEERRAILLTGRSLADLEIDPEDGKIRPLREIFRKAMRQRYGIVVLEYSLAGGLDWDRGKLDEPADRATIENALRGHGLHDVPRDREELVRVVFGVSRMSRSPVGDLRWSDGRPMRFAFHFLFGEHVVPESGANGGGGGNTLAAIELAAQTAESLALRASGNFLIFSARDGLMDALVSSALHHVHLPQPDTSAKARFVEAALRLYPEARLEEGLDPTVIANLTRNTPNASAEAVLRAAQKTGVEVVSGQFARERAEAVARISEGTLWVMDTEGVERIRLAGRNVLAPVGVLTAHAEALRKGDSATPRAVVLVGPPGTAKTVAARIVARRAGVAAFAEESPKGPYVGETERRVGLQRRLLAEWTPNIDFIDEITEALPLQRGEFNGDNGATFAWTASLLTALGDERLRGRSFLVGTTNCPWRVGAAQLSRLEFIPFLFPLPDDFASILEALARTLMPDSGVEASEAAVREAGTIFHRKGAGPREMGKALNRALLDRGGLGPQEVLWAAHDYCGATDLDSVLYADLWAVRVTTSRSYFPWSEDPGSYPFPPHLAAVVDRESGELDRKALERELARLRPHAKV